MIGVARRWRRRRPAGLPCRHGVALTHDAARCEASLNPCPCCADRFWHDGLSEGPPRTLGLVSAFGRALRVARLTAIALTPMTVDAMVAGRFGEA